MNTKGKMESFKEISTDDGVRNINNNENMGKRATETKIEFEQALAIGLNARSVDSLERKTTTVSLAICEIRGGGGADHETFARITLMNETHMVSIRFTRCRRHN